MNNAANKAIVRRYVEPYNAGDVDLADEVPLDSYDKGTRTERVQIRSMYPVELAQTGKIERTVL